MLLRSLIIILTPFLLYVGKSLATEAPELEALQKRLLLLEKEILDLKMKNVVEDKFEWQFLKMTEIENDIKKLHNRFEILENNYYKELKNLKALIVNSHTSNVEKVEDSNEDIQTETVIQPLKDPYEGVICVKTLYFFSNSLTISASFFVITNSGWSVALPTGFA